MLSSLLQKAGLRPGFALYSAIPKVLMAAAMVGGAGCLLSAGSAQADSTCTFGTTTALTPKKCSISVNDAFNTTTLLEGDKSLTFKDLPGDPTSVPYGGTITLSDLGFNFYTVATNFVGPLGPSIGPDTLAYDIKIISPGNYFTGVKLGAVSNIDAALVIKSEVSSPSLFAPLQVTSTQSDPPGAGVFLNLPGTLTSLSIRDTFSTPSPGALTSFTNTFRQKQDVPGPLPLMGAGMALGFSRKLRSRIKTSAKAKA